MEAEPVQPKRASTEAIFSFLGDVPWWIIIIAIVGLFVGFSVLTNIRYRDAIYFILDLPWDRNLVGEVPLEDSVWSYQPVASIPLRPGTYNLYAEYDTVQAAPIEDTLALLEEPAAGAAEIARIEERERVSITRWKVIPKQNLQPEQLWAFVETEDGRTGWALESGFSQMTFKEVARSEFYRVQVTDEAEPGDGDVISQSTGEQVIVLGTNTPILEGTAPSGSFVRIYDKYDLGRTLARIWQAKGLILSIRATLLGFGLALILGLLSGLMLVSKSPITLAIAKLYVEVIRGIPMLVIILYAGFVVSPALRDATGGRLDLRGFPGAVLGLGFGYGAYLAEVFRAGIQSIHYGQMEAARSLGMSYFQAMRHIVLPQAIRVVLPPLGNDFIAMLKDSSLISVVALPEILQQGRLWVSRTFRGFEGYNTVALFYLVMTLVLSLLVRFIERQAALPGRSED